VGILIRSTNNSVRDKNLSASYLLALVTCSAWLIGCETPDGDSFAFNAPSKHDAGQEAADDTASSFPDSCVPTTCEEQNAQCGTLPDGCGATIDCGECESGLVCGGAGPYRCGTKACIPKTCLQKDAQCGWISDDCSQAIDCGGCMEPQTCGANHEPNVCGCSPKTCIQLGLQCGKALDGCGGTIDCGTCAQGQHCGGGGPNLCGVGECQPKSCAQLGISCGLASDGCNSVVSCGDCEKPLVCGGGGISNECGCTPKTCAQLGASCGTIQTGCGEENCGSCTPPETCGGGGIENQCGCTCSLPHASTHCSAGQCAILACDPGWDDCDGINDNGCETDLNQNPDHCGECENKCNISNGYAICNGGKCELDGCLDGFGDCDHKSENGCETTLATNPNHCGTCGRACSGPCVQGKCEYESGEVARKWDQSYLGSGEWYTYDASKNYQGCYVGELGVLKSAIGAPDAMFSDLAGATVVEISVYLYAAHWYYFAGGTARIGVHGHASKPATFPGIDKDLKVDFERGEGKWIPLPSSWYDSFKSGTYRGITLHANNSTDGQYYGYMTANATKWKWKYRK